MVSLAGWLASTNELGLSGNLECSSKASGWLWLGRYNAQFSCMSIFDQIEWDHTVEIQVIKSS